MGLLENHQNTQEPQAMLNHVLVGLEALPTMQFEAEERFAPGREEFSPATISSEILHTYLTRVQTGIQRAKEGDLADFQAIGIEGGVRLTLNSKDDEFAYQFVIHHNPRGVFLSWRKSKSTGPLNEGDYQEVVIRAPKEPTTSQVLQ